MSMMISAGFDWLLSNIFSHENQLMPIFNAYHLPRADAQLSPAHFAAWKLE